MAAAEQTAHPTAVRAGGLGIIPIRRAFDSSKRPDFIGLQSRNQRWIRVLKSTKSHFKGVVFLTQKVLSMMNDGGSVVFITAAGDRYNVHGYAVYSSCKGAIEVFSRYVAKEYGPRGIRANTVAPGGIVTDFNEAAIRSNPKAQEFIKAQTAMGRLGAPHDIGGVVAFLCSEDSKWLTGQRLEVTGGFNL